MRIVCLCLLLLGLCGCSLEPRYVRPLPPIPEGWRFDYDAESTACNMRWWEELEDPALNDLILTALNNNKDLMVAIWRVVEFYARYDVVRSALYPQVNFSGTAIKERIPPAESGAPLPKITPFYSIAFNLSWELDFWGKLRSQSHAAYADALGSVEARRTVILTLVSNVAEAYMALRTLDKELEIAFKTLEERREYLRIATLRFKGGLTSEIEVTMAAAAFEEVLADITLLEQQIPQQEDLISLLIGIPSTNILRGKSIDTLEVPAVVPAGLPSELLFRRPDIMAAEWRLIATNALIGAARSAFFPQISLTGLLGAESFNFSTLFAPINKAWQIGFDVAQPIITGGNLTGQLNVSIAQKMEALYAYQQTILTAFKEVNDALVAYRQSQELVRVQEGNINANREYLRLSWLRYYNGQADYLVVLDAESRLFAAQISLTQAQGAVFSSLVSLYKALGGGWVIDADCSLRF